MSSSNKSKKKTGKSVGSGAASDAADEAALLGLDGAPTQTPTSLQSPISRTTLFAGSASSPSGHASSLAASSSPSSSASASSSGSSSASIQTLPPLRVDKLVSRFPKAIGRDHMAFVSLANMQRAGLACGDLVALSVVMSASSSAYSIDASQQLSTPMRAPQTQHASNTPLPTRATPLSAASAQSPAAKTPSHGSAAGQNAIGGINDGSAMIVARVWPLDKVDNASCVSLNAHIV
jgi:hypothetical protein